MECCVVGVTVYMLITSSITNASPKGEKISLNTELLDKVRQRKNDTDVNEKKHNFVWRISVTRTTPTTTVTTQRVKTTLSLDQLEKDPTAYQQIYLCLSATLRDDHYRKMWTSLVDKNFEFFIDELRQKGPYVFMKPLEGKDDFAGFEGRRLWKKTVDFLEASGKRGFEVLLDSINNLDLDENVTLPTTTTSAT